MAAGYTTVQQVLDALAEAVNNELAGITAYGSEVKQIQKSKLPCVIFTWFSDIDTTINNGSTQLWIVAAKCNLYTEAITGNELRPSLTTTNDHIHELIDLINRHPYRYPNGSLMQNLSGVDRINVVRVRPAEFGMGYAGQKFFGAELFLEIKLHRRIDY